MRKAFIITFFTILILSGVYSYFLTYVSNQHLYFTTLLLKDAGHIVVPGNTILASMLDFKTVLFGSFFITFTAGLVVTFTISFLVSMIYITRESFFKIIEIFLPVIISLTLVVTTLFIFDKDQMFSRVRDSFLFSNSFGKTINEFYYKYTLYADETLESPVQKQIKPCWIDPGLKEKSKIKKILFTYGWLTTNKIINTELVIKKNYQSDLDFIHNNKILFRTSIEDFIQNPQKHLSMYSSTLDSNKFLRILCSIGLMPGIPILVFLLLHFIIFMLFLSTNNAKKSNLIASSVTGFLLIGLLFYLNPEILKKPDQTAVRNMLFSSEARDRIQGLRLIHTDNYDIKSFNHIVSQLIEGKATEKHWLANVLGMKRTKENIKHLKKLINDDSMNVRYAAISALSEIDSSKNSYKIFKQIINNSNSKNNPNSNHWYVQFYAYNAYKKTILKN
ncbi:MAG: HEAT repeat domain-containing protein [Desulfobacteraceae bacterium]|nr:HEAT repeat domain-containing protein [Desulfobacteraceae bacterium]